MQHYSDGYTSAQPQPHIEYVDGTSQHPQPDYIVSPINLMHEGQQQRYQERFGDYGQAGPNIASDNRAQQQQYYAMPHYTPMPVNDAGIDGKILAAFSYMGCWVTGLIVLLFVRENRFVRFHAIQSLVFYGAINIIWVAFFSIVGHFLPWHVFRFPLAILVLTFVLVNVVAGIAWLVGIVGSLGGRYVKLPFVGDFAERCAGGRAPGSPMH